LKFLLLFLKDIDLFKFQNLKSFGIVDLTASAAPNALPHKRL